MSGGSVTLFFFFNDTATTEIYTLSLHDALPISCSSTWVHRIVSKLSSANGSGRARSTTITPGIGAASTATTSLRSEEHTSELQSRQYLVCRLLLEKKKTSNHALSVLIGPPASAG